MPCAIVRYQATPNPNALKCILDARISDRPRSFFNADQARSDPLASRLFGVEGVTNILIGGDWITVGKRPEAAWPSIKSGVERVLRESE